MVIAPARTGSDSKSRKAVTNTDHTNNGILCIVMPGVLIFKIVVIKLIAPRIDDAPAMWSDKIAKSIAGPGCPIVDRGGYIVHPPPTPFAPGGPGTNIEITSKARAGGNNQKDMLFILGKAMSGAPIIKGTNQLPKPPIMAGMTMKNIMISPCPVVKTL
jgi:hypothetical protein